ncbi:hypothetical protein RHMOL_Rhmol04G0216500 [Rhododendron molle]|uniref:Uncharacterized protein n=1 Tax=Rhododendron molle TaxID=49168 RepID=A0ACC0P468_RHOML|nr:hypothetical protein RHMOL_Rhmol04G0216500 [Rhododendron molle]
MQSSSSPKRSRQRTSVGIVLLCRWDRAHESDFGAQIHTSVLGVEPIHTNPSTNGSTISQFLASQSTSIVYQEECKQVWSTIGNICRTAIDSNELWKDENKSFGKRRALAHRWIWVV